MNPFSLRRSPYNLNQPGLRSTLLSDHPMTQKASREELAFRQRSLAERGDYEDASKVADAIESTPQGEQQSEYKYVLLFALLGYLSAHMVVFQIMGEDTRLPYDPVKGFVDDIADAKKVTAKVDHYLEAQVVGSIERRTSRTKSAPRLAVE